VNTPTEMKSGNPPRILIVDDETAILRLLHNSLNTGDFSLFKAENGQSALELAVSAKPDIILLDLGLPDMDGVEVIRKIRAWSRVPIIILSVREREKDKMEALDAGADDYLTKPFGVRELQARIRAALRRSLQETPEPVYRDGDLVVDLTLRQVSVAGEELHLSPTEYDLLRMLVRHCGKVLTHNQILRQIWGSASSEQQNSLRVNISNLRRKIEKDPSRPRFIITEPCVGYRLKRDDE